MLRPHGLIRTRVEVVAGLLLVVALAGPATCQEARGTGTGRAVKMWAALQKQKTTIRGSLQMAGCDVYPARPCTEYLIEALEFHWKGLRPNELKVTDLTRHRVILVDRDVEFFLYMSPLVPSGSLVATVWGTGTGYRSVRVYRLEPRSARLVFDNWSSFPPQLIVVSESTADPIILIDRSDETGAIARPTKTEISQWNPAAKKFILRATVPVGQRFTALARILGGGKK